MKKYSNGKRMFAQSLTAAAAMVACVGLQANDQQGQQRLQGNQTKLEQHSGQVKADKQAKMTAEQFVKHAAMGGQLEVRVGQMAARQAQNQEVKQLGQKMVQDHQKANQQLMQIAQQKNIQVDRQLDEEYQEKVNKLQGKSGAEFDQQFVKQTVHAHRMAIQKFEQATRELRNEQELRSFAEQQLPILKEHMEMAQNAARAIGLDEATLAGDLETVEPGVGSAPGGVQGVIDSEQKRQHDQNLQERGVEAEQPSDLDQPRTSVEQGRDFSASANLNTEHPDLAVNESSNADLDREAEIDVDTNAEVVEEDDDRVLGMKFQKGDGEVLGLPTSNNDGTILGLFPAPSREIEAGTGERYVAEELADGEIHPGVENVEDAQSQPVAVGGPGASQSEAASSTTISRDNTEAPQEVKEALRNQGWQEGSGELEKMTVYKTEIDGRKILVNEDGEIISNE